MNIRTFAGSISVLFLFIAPAWSQSIKNVIPDVARPLPLSSVRVTGGPLKRAQDLNADYLLKLEPDRMMAYYRKRAGLEPKAQGYGGSSVVRGSETEVEKRRHCFVCAAKNIVV